MILASASDVGAAKTSVIICDQFNESQMSVKINIDCVIMQVSITPVDMASAHVDRLKRKYILMGKKNIFIDTPESRCHSLKFLFMPSIFGNMKTNVKIKVRYILKLLLHFCCESWKKLKQST
jgi:hypothetical protein